MKRLILALYTIPALVAIATSLVLMERSMVLLGGILLCGLTMVMTCVLVGYTRPGRSHLWLMMTCATACLALAASVSILHWPLRLAYALSRPSLDRIAQDVQAGHPLVTPRRAGLFTISQAEVSRQGAVCLWVDPNPSGRTGFILCEPDRLPANLWSMVSLDERWQLISED